ncbi:EF_hand domain-containing protein [Hexamita inflata]|uniref:EF hand domain-containing protein n=1 Tax=Hexamita inflata TaxID=28002 RepID=A0AA86P5S6_9EUKA|nr:EF hand domain-containing protein [Hexamita inflata]CAI9971130.1 EF hand domain-containing protein [Hexamita inflata]
MGCNIDNIQEQVIKTDENGLKHVPAEYVRKYFQEADKDKSGSLDVDELIALLISLGIEITSSASHDISKTIQIADDNKNKRLEFHEFNQFLYSFINAPASDLPAILFYVGDKDESNSIDADELLRILKKVGSKASEDSVRELMRVMKIDVNGIDFVTFKKILEKLQIV